MRLASYLRGNRGLEKLNNQPQAPDCPAVRARESLSETWALPLARCPGRLTAPELDVSSSFTGDQICSSGSKHRPSQNPPWCLDWHCLSFKLHFTNRLLFMAIRLVPRWEPSLLQLPPSCACGSSWNEPILFQGQCRRHLHPQRPTGMCLSPP